MSPLRPEESEKTRSREAVRGPPLIVAPPFARAQAAPDCSSILSCSGPKPRSRDIAKRRGSTEIARKRHEFPGRCAFSNHKPSIRMINRILFQKKICIHELNSKFIQNSSDTLNSIIELYNRKRH